MQDLASITRSIPQVPNPKPKPPRRNPASTSTTPFLPPPHHLEPPFAAPLTPPHAANLPQVSTTNPAAAKRSVKWQ